MIDMDRGAVWSVEAEVGVLGAPFVDHDAVDEVRAIIAPSDFFREAHRRIWRAMVEIADEGGAVDVLTLGEKLKTRDELEAVGGYDAIAELIDAVPTAVNVEHYARIVRDKAKLRRLIDACQTTVRDVMEGLGPAEAFEHAERRLLEAAGVSHGAGGYRLVQEVLWDAMEIIEREAEAKGGVTGVPSGFPGLDRMTAGMQKGDLTILAARPSMGKTAAALSMGITAAQRSHPAAVASLEMGGGQLVKRALAMRADIDLMDIRRGALDDRAYKSLGEAASWLRGLPLHIDDHPGATMAELRVKVRRLARQGLDLLIVDYLQLMSAEGDNRVQEVSAISRGLKLLARELDIHVLALSQLNRAVEHRTPPRPQLSDLRDSGAIEQDADVVLMLWRPEYYFDDTTPDDAWAKWQGRGELIVAKQRNGPTGRILLQWDAKTTRFVEEDRLRLVESSVGENGRAS